MIMSVWLLCAMNLILHHRHILVARSLLTILKQKSRRNGKPLVNILKKLRLLFQIIMIGFQFSLRKSKRKMSPLLLFILSIWRRRILKQKLSNSKKMLSVFLGTKAMEFLVPFTKSHPMSKMTISNSQFHFIKSKLRTRCNLQWSSARSTWPQQTG